VLPTSEIVALLYFTTVATSPHDGFPVDLGSVATMNTVIASGVLVHNCTTPHDCFRVVVLHNCPTPHDGFPVDLGSAATMINVIAGGVLFHNGTTPHDCFCVDPNMSANTEMTSVTTGVECNSELRLV
jgi:UDP-N-acetylglucosamine enolpyruvyl transferase